LGRKPSEVLLGAIFVKSFSMKRWYAMFGIFLGSTSHIMTPFAGFPFFDFFLVSFALISNLGQTHGARRVC
jgi:hypothetical protein